MTATQARTTVISPSPSFFFFFPQTFIQGNNGGKIMSTVCQWVRIHLHQNGVNVSVHFFFFTSRDSFDCTLAQLHTVLLVPSVTVTACHEVGGSLKLRQAHDDDKSAGSGLICSPRHFALFGTSQTQQVFRTSLDFRTSCSQLHRNRKDGFFRARYDFFFVFFCFLFFVIRTESTPGRL